MFGQSKTKNKRITGPDWETELFLAKMFRRPLRTYTHDKPYYPYLVPTPLVNFHLNFKE